MVLIERLPRQVEGIGFVVKVRFRQPYSRWIDKLVDAELFGNSNSDVAQKLFFRWIEDRLKVFAALGVREDDAERFGYSPVKFDIPEDEERDYGVHQRQPLRIELYGQPAYLVDCLRKQGLFGKTRVEVVQRGVESRLLDQFDHYSIWLDSGKKKGR